MIIHCEKCGAEFESRKGACPDCGQPVSERQKNEDKRELLKSVAMIVAVSLVAIGFILAKYV
ncbi:MAG: hypothetical protein K6E26_01110 [Clostridiales bacterium]|nr:hypothetical protein [Clostridiales bacterium]